MPECLNDEMLLACYAKHNTSKMFPSCPLVSLEKVNNLKRRKSLKYAFVILGDVVDSNKCNTNKPQQKNWSKKKPHPCCTKALHAEQTDYDHQRYNRHHICQKRELRQFSQQSHPGTYIPQHKSQTVCTEIPDIISLVSSAYYHSKNLMPL